MYYSKKNYATLVASGIINVMMPKKGKLNKIEAEREGTKEFKKIRNKHSAAESNINMLEHHGLDVVRIKDTRTSTVMLDLIY